MYTPRQTKTKCDIVVDEILSMIAKGVYKENEKLPPEKYFVDYFGMSRVTIRESFKKLSMLGVVRIKQGEGTFVNKADMSTMIQPVFSSIIMDNLSVSQLYDARKYVESGVTRLAAVNLTEEQAQKLDELMASMDVATKNRDAEAFSALDVEFHEYIADASANYILAAVYKTIKSIISKYINISNLSPKTVEISQGYHKRIVEALKEHNSDLAGELMEEHVETTKDNFIKRMEAGEVPLYIR